MLGIRLPIRNTLRLSDAQVEALLSSLEREPEYRAVVEARRFERFPYRDRSVTLELTEGHDALHCNCPARNLSRGGIALLAGRFVYPGTRCRVRLTSERNRGQWIHGEVVRCRYISGTTGIHELGIRFDRPIEVELFLRAANAPRVLVHEINLCEQKLYFELLTRIGAQVVVEPNLQRAIEAAQSNQFDMTIFGRSGHTPEACAQIATLRAGGHVRPIVTVATAEMASRPAGCGPDECHHCRLIPLTSEALLRVVREVHVEPLLSSLHGDSQAAEAIQSFVASLGTRVRAIETQFADADFSRLAESARRLSKAAKRAGFELIHQDAETVAKLARGASSRGGLLHPMLQLIRHCRRANLPPVSEQPEVDE